MESTYIVPVNGYPQLPYISIQQRPPTGWWDNQSRKNFGEVVSGHSSALFKWQQMGLIQAMGSTDC